MKDIIKLKSRYGTVNYLKKIHGPNKPKTYILKTSVSSLRVGNINNGNKFIDPSGGPMIVVGYKLEEANAVVKSIDFIEKYGWTITFE